MELHLQIFALLWIRLCELGDALLDALDDLIFPVFQPRLLVRSRRALHQVVATIRRDERTFQAFFQGQGYQVITLSVAEEIVHYEYPRLVCAGAAHHLDPRRVSRRALHVPGALLRPSDPDPKTRGLGIDTPLRLLKHRHECCSERQHPNRVDECHASHKDGIALPR